MRVQEGQIFHLLDAKKHLVGLVTIREFDRDWVRGHFIPEADFALYCDLFLAHLEACNDMLMATVEDLGKKIDALGLHLVSPDGTKTQGIYSVEMMEGDGISFKVRLGYEGIPNMSVKSGSDSH